MQANDTRNVSRSTADKGLTIVALLAVGCLVFTHYLGGIYSASVDVAHHYSLVNWLTNHWSVPKSAGAVLGEMQVYPRYSHIVAAILGMMMGSPFLGMQITTALAVVVVLSAIAMTSRLLEGNASWVYTILLIALLAFNYYTINLDLFGREVILSYFFSQLVGQACLMLVIVAAARYEQLHGAGIAFIACILAVSIFMAGVHLLPSVEGIGYGLLLLALHALSDRRRLLGRILILGVVAMACGLALRFHPAFSAMRDISENNGFLPLNGVETTTRLLVLASVSLVVSALLVLSSITKISRLPIDTTSAAAKHLGCAGVAIAALCFLQIVALRFGLGSEYACKKYAFGLSMFLLMNVAMLVTREASRRIDFSHAAIAAKLAWTQPAIILAVLWAFTVGQTLPLTSTPKVIQIERVANFVQRSGVLENGKHNYARGMALGVFSDVANYLVSVGIFESPRDDNGMAVLRNQVFPNPGDVGLVLASADVTNVWSNASCVRAHYPGALVLTDGQCVLQKFSDLCAHDMDFSNAGFLADNMLSGFSHPESSGRWSEARNATFSCKYPEGFTVPTKVALTVSPFNPKGGMQKLDISVNGVHVGHFELSEPKTIEFTLPPEALAGKSGLSFDFSIPTAVSPQTLGISIDTRTLGFWFSRMSIQ